LRQAQKQKVFMKITALKKIWLIAPFLLGALCVTAQSAEAPKIQFEQTVYNFGKTSVVETVSGTFKFKNTGNAVLKLEAPKPSCGCTVASFKSDTLEPGETGELAFTVTLGTTRATMEKHIAVKSNDPQTPEVSLSIQVDYTPLYELNPPTLAPSLAFGASQTEQTATLTRTDGKPLSGLKFAPSKAWITARVEPSAAADETTARIHIEIQRDGSPRHFNESIQVYTAAQTNIPISTIYLYGEVMGEISANPESLYWSVTDPLPKATDRPEALVRRLVTITSANGKPFELKNPQSTIPGIHVELVKKEAGKSYDLVAKLDELPSQTVAGNLSFDTSVASQSRMEVPVIVNISKQ
jgi:hypothetical protein